MTIKKTIQKLGQLKETNTSLELHNDYLHLKAMRCESTKKYLIQKYKLKN